MTESTPLPPELETRIRAFERDPRAADFDRVSWTCIIAFGVALPLILLIIGWWA